MLGRCFTTDLYSHPKSSEQIIYIIFMLMCCMLLQKHWSVCRALPYKYFL